jgi:hypothetical protein
MQHTQGTVDQYTAKFRCKMSKPHKWPSKMLSKVIPAFRLFFSSFDELCQKNY